MIKAAFHEKWWKSRKLIRVNADGTKTLVSKNDGECEDSDCDENEYALIQYNFSLFFGIAVQLYQATLVSDDTPWDRFRRENPTADRSRLESLDERRPRTTSAASRSSARTSSTIARAGLTNIRCSNCHEQNELTDASVAPHRCRRQRAGPQPRRQHHRQGIQQHRRPADRRRPRRRRQRRVRSAVVQSTPAVPRRAHRRRSTAQPVTQGLRRRGRVQGPVAAQRGAHRAVLPQRRRAHAARGRRALQPRRQRVSRPGARRHASSNRSASRC